MTDSRRCREILLACVTVPHSGDMVSWADGKLKIPYSTRYPVFMAMESPWLLEPMRAMTDKAIRRVDVRAPAGSAKSLIGEVHIAFCWVNSPGLYYYVWQTDDDGKDAMEDRIEPMIDANEFLAKLMPLDRNKKRANKIASPTMSLYLVGANPSAAQSKRVKYLTMEEPHLYKPGMMTAFEKRCEGVKFPKILTLSTGSILGDESDESFCKGTCEEWSVPCPHCGEFQAMTDNKDRLLAQIDDETVDAEGEWNWLKILPTVRYNCEKCGKDWPADQKFRHDQSKLGKYIATNPNAPADHRSFHLEAVSVHYMDLGKILSEKMHASRVAKRGSLEPLKDYMQKRKAVAWDEAPSDSDEDAAFKRSKGGYLKRDPFEGEIARFLTIDNQAGKSRLGEGAHRWALCRSYGLNECRLIEECRVTSWEEVEELRIALGVEPARTLVDIAFDGPAVQAVCIRYGWQGLFGETSNKRSFPHHELVNVNGVMQRMTRNLPFSPVNVGHTGTARGGDRRQARYFFWCGPPIKDLWHRLKNGMTTYRWTVPDDISDEYRKQTSVEFKKLSVEKKTGRKIYVYATKRGADNHLTDCDQMNLVAALMDRRIREIIWSAPDEQTENNEPEGET